jgi:phospholipid/cholesterol/gamma-HCH transport system substrate-binding protein
MKPFRERNPVTLGVVGVLVVIAALLVGLNAGRLPFVGSGDNVRVAGVLVGKVSSVKLDDNVVKVGMKVNDGTRLGAGSTADIKIESVLGQVFVALTPTGTTPLPANTILVADTTTPTSIVTAVNGLGERAGEIDVAQLARSFDVLAATFRNTPSAVRGSLVGLERLSTTIASRNAELTALLGHTSAVTATLAAHDAQVVRLINDSNLILATVHQQRTVIHRLLVHTSALSKQLTAVVAENEKVIGPALTQLNGTLKILKTNQAELDQTVHLVAPFIRDFTDTLGNGRWFETTITNIAQVSPNGVTPPKATK